MQNHPVVHIEIPVKNPVVDSQWYADVFGWKLFPYPEMDYVTFEAEGGPGGGFPRIDGSMYKANDVTVYFDTADVDATLAKIVDAGGKVVLGKTPIPGMGWFALFEDPSGNRLALFSTTTPPAVG